MEYFTVQYDTFKDLLKGMERNELMV